MEMVKQPTFKNGVHTPTVQKRNPVLMMIVAHFHLTEVAISGLENPVNKNYTTYVKVCLLKDLYSQYTLFQPVNQTGFKFQYQAGNQVFKRLLMMTFSL